MSSHFPGAEVKKFHRSPGASAHQKLLRGIKAQAFDGRAVPREAPYAASSTDSPNVHPLPERVSQTTGRTGGEGAKGYQPKSTFLYSFAQMPCMGSKLTFRIVPRPCLFRRKTPCTVHVHVVQQYSTSSYIHTDTSRLTLCLLLLSVC